MTDNLKMWNVFIPLGTGKNMASLIMLQWHNKETESQQAGLFASIKKWKE